MKYKIGDKVKLAPDQGTRWRMGKKIGTIREFQCNLVGETLYALVSYEGYSKDTSQAGFPFRLEEIVRMVQKGEQLLFDFMKE